MKVLQMVEQRDNWNDDRLDELATDVKAGFAKVDARFDKVEGEMKEGFARVDARFEKVDQQFSTIRERLTKIETRLEGLPRLERLVLGFGSALLLAVLGPRFF
jgi:archaellum component FlaC